MRILLGGIIILFLVAYAVYNLLPKTDKEKENKNKRQEIQEIIDDLRVKMLSLRKEAEAGKVEAINKLRMYEEDYEVAKELLNKYK